MPELFILCSPSSLSPSGPMIPHGRGHIERGVLARLALANTTTLPSITFHVFSSLHIRELRPRENIVWQVTLSLYDTVAM